jgi:hypothetical protein
MLTWNLILPGEDVVLPFPKACVGCPIEIPVDSPQLKEALTHSIGKLNAENNETYYFKIETVKRATSQVCQWCYKKRCWSLWANCLPICSWLTLDWEAVYLVMGLSGHEFHVPTCIVGLLCYLRQVSENILFSFWKWLRQRSNKEMNSNHFSNSEVLQKY